jgi:hypothetical protein
VSFRLYWRFVRPTETQTAPGHCFHLYIRVNIERPSDVKIGLEPQYPIITLCKFATYSLRMYALIGITDPPVYPHFDLYYSSYNDVLDKESKLNSEANQYPAIMLCTKTFSNFVVVQPFINISDEPLDPNSESALLASPERPSEHIHVGFHSIITVEMQEIASVEPPHAAPDDKSIPSLPSPGPHFSERHITSSHSHSASHGEPSDGVVPNVVVVSLDKGVAEYKTPSRTRPKSRGLAPAFPLQPTARHSIVAGAPANGVPPGLQRAGSVTNRDLVVPPLRPIRRSPVSPSFTSPPKESPRRPLPDIPENNGSVDKPEVSPPPRPIRRLPAPVDPPLKSVLRHSTLPRRPLPDIPSADLDQRRRSEFIVAPAPDYHRNRPHSPNEPQPSDEFDHVAHVHGGKPRPKPRDSLVLRRAKEYDAARGSFAIHSSIESVHTSYRFVAEKPQTAKSQGAGTDCLEELLHTPGPKVEYVFGVLPSNI